MITTLTLNPSLDRTLDIDRLDRGEVLRVASPSVEVGGKGINVARALHQAGVPAVAVFPVGGPDGSQVERGLAEIGVDHRVVTITGSTRTNITIVESDGTVTKLNEPGPSLSADDIAELEKAALSASSPGGWLVLSGSLPPRCPPDVYARFATAARALEARVAVDTSGPPLTEAVGKGPDLIKPNLEEFQELVARPTRTVREALEACRWLQEAGVGTVLLSMGDRGALLVGADSVLYGFAAVSDVRNTVGAGDALLAGFLAAEDPPEERLRRALAWSAAAVRSSTTAMAPLTDEDLSCVRIVPDVDPDTTLRDLRSARS